LARLYLATREHIIVVQLPANDLCLHAPDGVDVSELPFQLALECGKAERIGSGTGNRQFRLSGLVVMN